MSASIRLLYVVNDTPYFVAHWLERAVAAKQHGYEVHLAGSDGLGVDRVLAAGLQFHAVPFTRGRSNAFTEGRSLRAVTGLYDRLRPDLVHHITIKPIIYGGLAARWHRVPAVVNTVAGLGYVFGQTGPRAVLQRTAVKWAYRVALARPQSKVIFENPDDRLDFLRWGLVSPDQGLVIKGAGVDLCRFRPHAVERTSAPTVVLASRLLWDKGVAVFVEAAALVKREHPEARMILVGSGDPGSPASIPESQLHAWARGGAVEWCGQRNDMPDVLADATVVCLPTFYREGIPRVLIEAAACGRPIVTTDMPGCREIVRDGENGLLVPVKNPVALAAAIGRLLADPDLCDRMGRAGRTLAEAEFGTDHVVAQTLAVYDQLAPGASPEARR